MARMSDAEDAKHAHNRGPLRITVSERFGYEQSEDLVVASDESRLVGRLSRFAYEVFDSEEHCCFTSNNGLEVVLRETPARQQIKALFFEDDREVARLLLQRFGPKGTPHKDQINLSGSEVTLLRDFLEVIGIIDLQEERGIRFSLSQVRAVLQQAEARKKLYDLHKDELYELIEGDVDARDVIAVSHRRQVLEEFARLLDDDDYFDQRSNHLVGDEAVWQDLFERNQWLLGMNLSFQFLSSWNPGKLEATVRGFSTSGRGKRVDALMATAGAMRSLCFVEIKTHRTDLLRRKAYRGETWPPAEHLAGGVAQLQATVEAARDESGSVLREYDADGAEVDGVLICRPRSVLIVGSLREFRDDGAINWKRYRSFESFRRSLVDPEIVTFDELYERARLSLESIADQQGTPAHGDDYDDPG